MEARSWQALVAAAIALAVDALYLIILWGEGEGELTSARVLFVATCVAGAAGFLVWGVTRRGRARAILFASAAAMLVAWSLIGALSIGILLAPGAVLAVFAAGLVGGGWRRDTALAALGAVGLVAAGLLLT
jgi:hypothetical protein